MLKDKKERTIANWTCTVATGKTETKSEAEAEKALRAIWQEISYLVRRRKYGTVEVQFLEITTNRLHSVTSLKVEEVMFLFCPYTLGGVLPGLE